MCLLIPVSPRILDENMLASYFSVIGPQPAASTFFREVREVSPGTSMVASPDGMQEKRFRRFAGGKLRFASDADAVEQFRVVLRQAVSCRLPAAEPAAVLMSGGLDSTTVAALAASSKGRSHLPLFASSWVFDELEASDERKFIAPVVKQFDLRWLPVQGDNLWPLSDYETWPHDPNTPFEGPYRRLVESSYEALAAHGCSVLLNGQFGDHLFTGWGYWLRDLLSEGRILAAASELFNGLKSSGVRGIRSALVYALLGRRRNKYRRNPKIPWLNASGARLLADYLETPGSARRPEQWIQLCNPINPLASTLEIRRAARYGLENRRPFLDLRLIELALQMPAHLFYRSGTHKWLLRELNRGVLPEKTRTRRWTSTLAPLFIRGLFEREADQVRDLLWSNDRHWPAMVREDWMRENIASLKAGAPDGVAWVVLWRVLTYEIWRRREAHMDGQS